MLALETKERRLEWSECGQEGWEGSPQSHLGGIVPGVGRFLTLFLLKQWEVFLFGKRPDHTTTCDCQSLVSLKDLRMGRMGYLGYYDISFVTIWFTLDHLACGHLILRF